MSTLTTTQLTFTALNGDAVAEVTAVSALNIHIEKQFKGDITIQQKTCSDSFSAFTVNYDDVYTFQNVLSKEFDLDGVVFPKKIKIVCHNYKSGDTLPQGCYSYATE